MVGRFDYRKGADTMLLAFDKVLQSHPAARLTLVGPADGFRLGSGKVVTFAEFAQANLSPYAASRVTLTGTLGREEIAWLRRNAFVTVVASRFENFPYALMEGLSVGSPMISTAWPASGEIISDGETGFLTPVADPDAMASRICWLMDHPEAAASVGAGGQRHCANTFSAEAVGKRLIECFGATIRSAGA
jgi:glycosyltransferase involved in cell wall biosynthesis